MTEEPEIREVCLPDLEEAIQYLRECRERLEKALKNIDELRRLNENLVLARFT